MPGNGKKVIRINADADPLNADWTKVVRYGEDEVLRRWGLTREEYEQRYR